jgi:hypothetical protein
MALTLDLYRSRAAAATAVARRSAPPAHLSRQGSASHAESSIPHCAFAHLEHASVTMQLGPQASESTEQGPAQVVEQAHARSACQVRSELGQTSLSLPQSAAPAQLKHPLNTPVLLDVSPALLVEPPPLPAPPAPAAAPLP